ncbi:MULTISPECIES: ABC-ATPase domain-containing protein [Staphylococcus]|uniref:ABC-ATPase domain-containing protein n=1 Tax=Staphylococcus TaxID=1279 RepID=UPI001AEBC2AC|nr:MULTISPECIES: ABC-ATPase domain-containing protein [Staphylococcus]MCD8838672.1 ABC-ATPase domain-containing protein [Staphylococcus arlettae]MCD8866258.1 ABC-ATPase domain-containing protein [Staphylococcus arlettae]
MKQAHTLFQTLQSLDGQKYGAYKRLSGTYAYNNFQLAIDHIQTDPYAPPSKVRIIINKITTGIPEDLIDTKLKRIAVSDFLTRNIYSKIHKLTQRQRNYHANIMIDNCGPEILERSAVTITDHFIEVCLEIGLPAKGRKILGTAATHIFKTIVPEIVARALSYKNIDQVAFADQVTLMEDQQYIREFLVQQGYIAFVANGSILPRQSGVSQQPLTHAVSFTSPATYEQALTLPSGKQLTGMAIPEGITLIVGGGYHGKSTLLEALQRGVYPHIVGDGREYVITRDDAMKIRAEDGRSIAQVNIQPFIDNLPGNKDTTQFTTPNASGSTSQAANVMEALEARSSVLLIDEDTSATNFMIRDDRMQQLIAPEKEPITPFAHKVKPLYDDYQVSTILIVGGSGDYFDVADHVLMMDEYVLQDVTTKAHDIAKNTGVQKPYHHSEHFGTITQRTPLTASFNSKGKDGRFKVKGRTTILYNKEPIDLAAVEQLVDTSQTNCLALMLAYYQRHLLNDTTTLSQAVRQLYQHIDTHGLAAISPYQGHPGNLALPRPQEFYAALNRYRGLQIAQHK